MRRWLRPLAFLLLIGTLLYLNRVHGWSDALLENLKGLRGLTASHPLKAALIYVAATAAGCVLLALPGAAFAAIAGLMFDPLTGTLLCLAAATLGAVLAFLAGRYFLRDAVRPWLERSPILKRVLFDDVNRSGFALLMVTRLVPLFPYNLQNFAYGLTDIGLGTYTLCTFVFMAPGAAAFTLGAAGLGDAERRGPYLFLAATLFVLVTTAGFALRRRCVRAGGGRE
ncbi:MAG: TVP38/TMEM64 family protein [Fretibacterium sp.]|nr:TVP38/TMEM64 family protein [Fretibacterium sp.]